MSGYFVNKLDLDNTACIGETTQCLAFGGHGTCYQNTLLSEKNYLKILPGSGRKLDEAETLPQTSFSL